jgi:hypothetical protein
MTKFLIEVPHEPEAKACLEAVRILLATGSHYLTHADFGCSDGEHKAWIMVEVDTREEARNILPPLYRTRARIVRLNKFALDEVDQLIRQHQAEA